MYMYMYMYTCNDSFCWYIHNDMHMTYTKIHIYIYIYKYIIIWWFNSHGPWNEATPEMSDYIEALLIIQREIHYPNF